MYKPVLLFSSLFIIMGVAVTAFALARPIGHWDVIAYVAAALKNLGAQGESLHRATFEVIRDSYDPAVFMALTSTPEATGHGAYRHTVATDPIALEQQLPFYRIRVVYIWLLNALAPMTGGLVGAAQLISATCAGLITCIAGWLLIRGACALPPVVAVLVLPLIVAGSGVIGVGQMETPDALAALIALLAVALLHSHRLASFILMTLLVLVRTDGVLLMGLAVALLLIERETRPHYYLIAGFGVLLYLFVNAYYDNYGHLLLFNFTLMNDAPDPYPATMAIETDIIAYAKIYVFAVIRFAPTLLLAAIVLLLVAADIRKTGQMVPYTTQMLLAMSFMIVHFALFPLGSDRYYVFPTVFAAVYSIRTLFFWATEPRRFAP